MVRGLIVGGRLDYSVSGNTSIQGLSYDISTYDRASYSGLFDASVSVGVDVYQELNTWYSTAPELLGGLG